MDKVFLGTVEKGKLLVTDRELFKLQVTSLEGKEVDVIVRKHKRDRSNNQNRYMWGCVYKILSDQTGHSVDEIHDSMRMMFLLDREKTPPTLKSTTELSTLDMETYLESIRQWASQELQCVIPLPNEVNL